MHSKDIDCLIIGNNQMVFSEYVNDIRKMGERSGAFRDLNLSFYEEDGRIVSCTDFYNKYYRTGSDDREMTYDNIFSATISYLGSFLNKHGMTFDYVNAFQEGKPHLQKMLKSGRVRTVAVTTTYYVSVLPVLEIIQFIKKYDDTVKIIIGGPFVSTQYKINNESSFKFLVNQVGADFYVINSQGEQALVNIINSLKNSEDFTHIQNLIYKKDGEYHFNPLSEENNELKENMVNWELFRDDIKQSARKMVMARTATSCPFSCSFCSFPEHAGTYRYVEPEILCKELDQLIELPQVNSVTFIDDTFNVPLRRYKEILRMFRERKYNFRWNCNFRSQYADEECVAMMKECGCEGVFLGIESGSDTILKNMNKSAKVEQYRKGIALLKKYDILTYASFIIGFPGETEETVRETIDLIETAQPDFFRAQLWYYDTMTPIHKEAQKYGLRNSQFEWGHNTMNSEEAAEWIDYLHRNIRNSVWLPQNDFDFPSLFNLLSRGWTVAQVKEMIRAFNEKVHSRLYLQHKENMYLDNQLLMDAEFNF